MHLIELWDSLLVEASEEERAIARHFHHHIQELSDELGAAELPQEYPKWVRGQVVANAEEEAALTAPDDSATDIETKVYSDGTSATGLAPLPDRSPAQQDAVADAEGGAPAQQPPQQQPEQSAASPSAGPTAEGDPQ